MLSVISLVVQIATLVLVVLYCFATVCNYIENRRFLKDWKEEKSKTHESTSTKDKLDR